MSIKQKRILVYYLKQKMCGLALTFISIWSVFALDGDITFAIFMLPVGAFLIITKQRVMTFRV